jgi:hypothetical protein
LCPAGNQKKCQQQNRKFFHFFLQKMSLSIFTSHLIFTKHTNSP